MKNIASIIRAAVKMKKIVTDRASLRYVCRRCGSPESAQVKHHTKLDENNRAQFGTCFVRLFRSPSVTILRGGALGRAAAESSSITLESPCVRQQ